MDTSGIEDVLVLALKAPPAQLQVQEVFVQHRLLSERQVILIIDLQPWQGSPASLLGADLARLFEEHATRLGALLDLELDTFIGLQQ
eukprot:5617603-Pleurochrysis_carterae.AAC.1